MKHLNIPYEVYFDTDIYIAECGLIQGAYASGNTPSEAIHELSLIIDDVAELNGFDLGGYKMETKKMYFTSLPTSNDELVKA